jgi:nucleoside-diphosphate kinase
METTLILLKPDCFNKNMIGQVIARFEKSDLVVCGCKMLKLSKEILEEHYAHIAQKPFFGEVLGYMQSTPVIALALSGNDSVSRVRDLVGPTDSRKAEKGTIRGDLGEDNMRNVVHASDSPESAAVELKRFFQDGEVFAR